MYSLQHTGDGRRIEPRDSGRQATAQFFGPTGQQLRSRDRFKVESELCRFGGSPAHRVLEKGEFAFEIFKIFLSAIFEQRTLFNAYYDVKVGDDDVTMPNERVTWDGGNLTISSITKDDFGIWQCVVSNPVADVTTDVMVYVKCEWGVFQCRTHLCLTIPILLNQYSDLFVDIDNYDNDISLSIINFVFNLIKKDFDFKHLPH